MLKNYYKYILINSFEWALGLKALIQKEFNILKKPKMKTPLKILNIVCFQIINYN